MLLLKHSKMEAVLSLILGFGWATLYHRKQNKTHRTRRKGIRWLLCSNCSDEYGVVSSLHTDNSSVSECE